MTKSNPILYVLSGLPGTGKTTMAKMLSQYVAAAYLRIDTVEQGLRELCDYEVVAEGYRLSNRIAQDNLRNGVSVVADSCNPVQLSREEWQQVAKDSRADLINIFLYCSDQVEHQKRIESRQADIEGLELPSWQQVQQREFDPWDESDITLISIDTSNKNKVQCFQLLKDKLNAK
ncbi:MAG: AAA family ATPase [Kangiellaceae bacterium]|nr:AAA family ATPase [Kangiellaceae bacterium]MCW8999204.1 AAA family ATPase [Kangiellaceae bacterium]MCW9017792.1 AAA family ATPase [Kangiellaceae bacterium]